MTIASECIVAGELGLRYAAVCVVDNLANGIGELPLTVGELEADRGDERRSAGRRARCASCRRSTRLSGTAAA